MKFDRTKLIEALRSVVQRMHYRVSFRNVEEVMAERGVWVDHWTLHRWSHQAAAGATVAFLLRAKQDHAAAREFFKRAIGLHDGPKKISID